VTTRARGMTLVELMVALALLSMLSVGLISSFRLGLRTYGKLTALDRTYWDVVSTQRFLRNALQNTYPFEPDMQHRERGLEGTATRLSVTAPMTRADGAAGFRRYTFSFVPGNGGDGALVAASEIDRNGAYASAGDRARADETLIEHVQDAQWSYRSFDGDASWRSEWAERRLPALVRLRVVFAPGDLRKWPDLVVAPRITDDANCQFDVVAQACREFVP